jgi:2-dehydropantoate 2-reductase
MKILVFGAGVLGSLYAARLHQAGHAVTLLARGARLAALSANGVQLEHALTGVRETIPVPVTDVADGDYDAVLVFVRADQLGEAAQTLGQRPVSRSIVFMVNNPGGHEMVGRAVGPERVILGFPGAGGYRHADVVHFVVLPRLIQPTTLGEPDGTDTARLREIRAALRSAGFPVATDRRMDAWYRYHAAWVTPIAYALYAARASGSNLADRPDLVRDLVGAIRELFHALDALGENITPARLRVIQVLPRWLLVPAIGRVMRTRLADTAARRHAEAAPGEMSLLAEEITRIASRADVVTPRWSALFLAGEPVRVSLSAAGPA